METFAGLSGKLFWDNALASQGSFVLSLFPHTQTLHCGEGNGIPFEICEAFIETIAAGYVVAHARIRI